MMMGLDAALMILFEVLMCISYSEEKESNIFVYV